MWDSFGSKPLREAESSAEIRFVRFEFELRALENDEAVRRLHFVDEIHEVLPFALGYQRDAHGLVIRTHFRRANHRVLDDDGMLLRNLLGLLEERDTGTSRIRERRLLLFEERVALQPQL